MRIMILALVWMTVAAGIGCQSTDGGNADGVDSAAGVDGATGVGEECLQPAELAPPDGYDRTIVYIETGSQQCQTGVCMVYKLQGNTNRDTCVDTAVQCTDPETFSLCRQSRCAEDQEVQDHVYCSCRCDGASGCSCPGGFACQEVAQWDGQESYCVRSATISD